MGKFIAALIVVLLLEIIRRQMVRDTARVAFLVDRTMWAACLINYNLPGIAEPHVAERLPQDRDRNSVLPTYCLLSYSARAADLQTEKATTKPGVRRVGGCHAVFIVLTMILWPASMVSADEQVHLMIVGGLEGVGQYERLERSFWINRIEELSNHRIKAEIQPFDRSGFPGQDMLQLMRVGVVPFGTALLALVSGDAPELNAIDLPGLNPNSQALRGAVTLYRPYMEELLKLKFRTKLLAVYTYPAQVIFCKNTLRGLADLSGRRIRTSSVGQSEMVTALGSLPILLPFRDVVDAVRIGGVDCVITAALSGYEIGLSDLMSYIYPMPISWGISLFGANLAAWERLPPDLRVLIQTAIKELEGQIWEDADRESTEGIACSIGAPGCTGSRTPGQMTLVHVAPNDEALRKRLFVQSVLPGWIGRCGSQCGHAWNRLLAPELDIWAATRD
jgi:TRAP-type C4-dicarboxylate transport system substrate-binding protein